MKGRTDKDVILVENHIRTFLKQGCGITDEKIQNQYINTYCKEHKDFKIPKKILSQPKKIVLHKHVFIINRMEEFISYSFKTAGIEQKPENEQKSLVDSLISI